MFLLVSSILFAYVLSDFFVNIVKSQTKPITTSKNSTMNRPHLTLTKNMQPAPSVGAEYDEYKASV